MSLTYVINAAATRAAIALALGQVRSTVDDQPVQVTGYLTRPDTVNAYDAWPEFRWASPVTGCLAETNWYAICALTGADLASSVDAADALMSALADALMGLGRVERVEPVLIPMTDQAGLAGLRCELTI